MATNDDARADLPEGRSPAHRADDGVVPGAAVTAAASDGAEVDASSPDSPEQEGFGSKDPSPPVRRSGKVLWIAAGAAVLAVAAVVVVVVLNGRGEPAAAPTTPPAVTITNPLPTPVGTPVEREKETPLQQALPDTVLQWTVTSQERTELAEDPLESYRLTYTGDAGGTVVVDVVQTRTPEDAAAASILLGEDGPQPGADSTLSEMGVIVGDRTVGAGSLMTGGERGLAVWTNGTTALRATGPGDAIENFYLAFPL